MIDLTRAFLALARIPDRNETRPRFDGIHANETHAIASDSCILARCPRPKGLDGGMNYTPAVAFQKAATAAKARNGWAKLDGGTLLARNREPQPIMSHPAEFPDGSQLLTIPTDSPRATIALSPTYLRMLADMADDAGATLVRLAIEPNPAKGQMTTNAVRFQMNGKDGEIRGAVMPMLTADTDWTTA